MKHRSKLDVFIVRSINAKIVRSVDITRIKTDIGGIAATNPVLKGARGLIVHNDRQIVFHEVGTVEVSWGPLVALLGTS